MELRTGDEWTIGDVAVGAVLMFAFIATVNAVLFVIGNALGYPNGAYVFTFAWMSWAILRTMLDKDTYRGWVFNVVAGTILALGMSAAALAQWLVRLAGF